MPRVLGAEPRDRHVAALHVPVGHQIHSVRVHQHAQLNHVVQEAQRLVVGAADHLPDVLEQLLRAERFGGVQPAVDPDNGLALLRERAGGVVGQALGAGEAAGIVL